MPELIECTMMAEQLNEKFVGQMLLSIQWYKKPGKFVYNCAYTEYPKFEKLLPLKLIKVWNKGKKIIFELTGNVYLVSLPLMSGSWIYKHTDHQKFRLNFESPEEKKETDNFAVFDDVRSQGIFNMYFDEVSLNSKLAEIGPDYLHGNITLEQYRDKITQKKLAKKEICNFLMDQVHFSGVGAYLKSEILYACAILPTRLLKDLTSNDIENLYNNTMKIIKLAYESKGLTIKNYKTPDGSVGTYKVAVYGRKVDDYGNKVITGTFTDKRTSHYVIEIQK